MADADRLIRSPSCFCETPRVFWVAVRRFGIRTLALADVDLDPGR